MRLAVLEAVGAVPVSPDQHAVAGQRDRPAEIVTSRRRRVVEGLQQRPGGGVKQMRLADIGAVGVV